MGWRLKSDPHERSISDARVNRPANGANRAHRTDFTEQIDLKKR